MSNNSDREELSLIDKAIFRHLVDLHTAMPGKVIEFDPTTQLAKVQPLIKRIFKEIDENESIKEVPKELPICINVLCLFVGSNGFVLTTPIKPDDECLLIFSERAYDLWYESGEVSKPNAFRQHDLSDAVAIFGLRSKQKTIANFNPDFPELRNESGDTKIVLKDDEIIHKATTKVTIQAPDTVLTGNLEVLGDTALGAVVTSDGVDISKDHAHDGPETAPSGPISDTGKPKA